jgi:hypothetical protein
MPYFEFWGDKQAKDRIDSNVLTRGTKMVIQVSRVDKGFATANHAKFIRITREETKEIIQTVFLTCLIWRQSITAEMRSATPQRTSKMSNPTKRALFV